MYFVNYMTLLLASLCHKAEYTREQAPRSIDGVTVILQSSAEELTITVHSEWREQFLQFSKSTVARIEAASEDDMGYHLATGTERAVSQL